MKSVNKPWFAFKVLAAGAIEPKDGFRHAFETEQTLYVSECSIFRL